MDCASRQVEDFGQLPIPDGLVFMHVSNAVNHLILKAGIVVGLTDAVSLLIDCYELHALLYLHLMPLVTA